MQDEESTGESALHPRDILLRDKFTHGEAILYGALLFFGVLSAWLGSSDSLVLGGCFIIGGILSPFLLRVFQLSHPFFIERLYSRVLFLTVPVLVSLAIFILGFLQEGTAPVKVDGEVFTALEQGTAFFPSSAEPIRNGFSLATFITLYLVAIFAYIVPKSRSFTERLLPWLCLNVVLVALTGLVAKTFLQDTGRGFLLFPQEGHWAALALLWMVICFAMALRILRYSNNAVFIQTTSPWYLGGAAVLAISVAVLEPTQTSGLVLVTFGILSAAAASTFSLRKEDPHRIALTTTALLTALAVAGTGMFFLAAGTDSGTAALREAGWRMFADRPLFGWGMGSFNDILPFYLSDWHPDARANATAPGILELLAEHGLIGLLPFAVVAIALLRDHFSDEHNFPFSRHLLVGCLAVVALLPVGSPLRSPAVAFNLLLVFFTSLRWTEVSRKKVDETESRPQLITPSSKRRVPFYTGPVKEQFK